MAVVADERSSARELLTIYLHDHRAGAAAGSQLVRRCRRNVGAGELGATLAWLETEIDQDRRTLDSIMDGFGIRPSRVKMTASVLAERLGRLKLNGHLWKRSPLSTVLELEAMAAAVYTKRNLWESLAAMTQLPAATDSVRLQELIARATDQLQRVQAHHGDAAREAFDPAAARVVDEPHGPPTTQQVTSPATDSATFQPPGDSIDQLLEDAEGGIDGSSLDA
jgi:hypothetical protein